MAHTAFYFVQITKKNVVLAFLVCLGSIFSSCGGGSGDNEARQYCLEQTDSLWKTLAKTRENFKFSMDEISMRKEHMEEELRIFKTVDSNALTPENRSMIVQYNAIFRVYKPIAGRYKNVVLKTEDAFFQIKVLEKSVKKGEYDNKIAEYKKVWQNIHSELIQNLEESTDLSQRLSGVEPAYLRLADKMGSLAEKYKIPDY